MPPVAQVGWLLTNVLGIIWKEAATVQFEVLSRCLPGPSEYEPEIIVVFLPPRCSDDKVFFRRVAGETKEIHETSVLGYPLFWPR